MQNPSSTTLVAIRPPFTLLLSGSTAGRRVSKVTKKFCVYVWWRQELRQGQLCVGYIPYLVTLFGRSINVKIYSYMFHVPALIRLKFITKTNECTWIYERILLYIDHLQFQAVHYILAHQSGPQSTTHTFCLHHSTKAYQRQQLVTSNILCSSLFYQLTVIFTKNYIFLTAHWFPRIIIVLLFFFLLLLRWSRER